MFKIETEVGRPRVLFTVGDRDLAIAFAEMEGYMFVAGDGGQIDPGPIAFGKLSHRDVGEEPEQVAPYIYSYRIRKAVASERRARAA